MTCGFHFNRECSFDCGINAASIWMSFRGTTSKVVFEPNKQLLNDKEKLVARIASSFGTDYEAMLQTGTINQATFEFLGRIDSFGYLTLQNYGEAPQKSLLAEAD